MPNSYLCWCSRPSLPAWPLLGTPESFRAVTRLDAADATPFKFEPSAEREFVYHASVGLPGMTDGQDAGRPARGSTERWLSRTGG